eukprot:5015310-Amphidinium_carterae.1
MSVWRFSQLTTVRKGTTTGVCSAAPGLPRNSGKCVCVLLVSNMFALVACVEENLQGQPDESSQLPTEYAQNAAEHAPVVEQDEERKQREMLECQQEEEEKQSKEQERVRREEEERLQREEMKRQQDEEEERMS